MLLIVVSFLKFLWDLTFLYLYCTYVYIEIVFRFFIPRKLKSLQGEVILITGAGDGIGKQICFKLAKLGATLICWDINKKNNDAVVRELKTLGAHATGFHVDVSNKSQVESAAQQIRNEIGDVSIIINNAGIGAGQRLLDQSPEMIERTFQVNVLAHFWILREFLPRMIENSHGHIVSVCSVAGFLSGRFTVPYGGSKFAVRGYIMGLKDELASDPRKPDIKFTTVYPSFINTSLLMDQAAVSTRFGSQMPIQEPGVIAGRLVDGMRRNKEHVFSSFADQVFVGFVSCLPERILRAGMEFLKLDVNLKPSRHLNGGLNNATH